MSVFHGNIFYISPKEKHFKKKKEKEITRTFSPSANVIVTNETTRGRNWQFKQCWNAAPG